MKLKILNKKAVKEILALIKKQWNADINLDDYAFLKSEKGKIYIVNREIDKIDFKKLRIDAIGLYFAFIKDNKLRLSIEGSQLIGPKAKNNVYELNDKEVKEWMLGEDLITKATSEEFVIIKHKKDFLGTGKIKQGKILNFIPKGRRLKTVA
jgi:NOL1/NOP2/fmu family ribosome biogenesis protein